MSEMLNSDFIKKDKIVQHTVNGISRFLMLWIIMEQGPIHGYLIIKELDNFFENLIDVGSLRKSSPSRIYPILKEMENNGLIKGDVKFKDNKRITYYELTEEGRFLVFYIRESYMSIKNSHQGQLFSKFINNQEF